ncbi:MAG TPA: hypothetical protein PLW93_00090 [Candidatus Absconditabacterales bacterium]|nr:hypothetical protein [Candidatus Absconditabacterales bacterium]HNG96652.1 hypothetical protein [Candidatus Absconditabacterales bacterium]
MLPVQQETQQTLSSTIKKNTGLVDFFQGGMESLGKQVDKTLDVLIGSKGPKAQMITHEMSKLEDKLIKHSKHTTTLSV